MRRLAAHLHRRLLLCVHLLVTLETELHLHRLRTLTRT
jgi:hypothetical protein